MDAKDSALILRKKLAEQSKKLAELENAFGILFAKGPESTFEDGNRDTDRQAAALYGTLCKEAYQ